MQKVLILSDLHHDGSTEADDRIRAGLAHAMARHGDAKAMILAGDLAHTGAPAQYRALARLFDRVKLPVIPMTGNHDRRQSLLAAFPGAATNAQGHVQTTLDLHRHRLIMLDTLDGPPYRGHRHSGHLCPDRMAWLMKALETAGERHRIVIAHHPAMKIGMPGLDAIRLDDGATLLDLLSSYPGTMLITGHVHRAASGMSRGVAWHTLGPLCAPNSLCLDTEEITPSTLPPSYGVLLLQKHGAALHQEPLA